MSKDSLEYVLEDGQETRRHIDMVAERIESQLQSLAEGQMALREYMGRRFDSLILDLTQLNGRLMRLEAGPPRR